LRKIEKSELLSWTIACLQNSILGSFIVVYIELMDMKRKRRVLKDRSVKVEYWGEFYVIVTMEVKAKNEKELIKKLRNGDFKIKIDLKKYDSNS